MRSHLALLTILTALAGCSGASEPSAEATDYIKVQFKETGTPESCNFEQLSTIAKSAGLYMVDYKRAATGKGRFPGQLKFTGHDGIDYVRDETISGALDSGPCKSFDVVWRQPKCKSVERTTMTCPEIRFEGGETFRSISVD